MKRAGDDVLEPILNVLRFPEEPLHILHPFKIRNDDPPEFARMSGMMKMPLSVRIRSASSVVGPLAPSARIRQRNGPRWRR